MGRLAAALAAAAVAGCAAAPRTPDAALARLAGGGWLAGAPLGVTREVVLNAEDLVWSIAASPDARTVAVVRLAADGYRLALFDLRSPGTARADVLLGPVDHDVEAVEVSWDGAQVATAGRDGWLRLFDASTGAPLAALDLGEPLVCLAFAPDAPLLVAGAASGRLHAASLPGLARAGEVAAHAGEVRGLAFAPDGRLFSGGWDKVVRRHVLHPRAPEPEPEAASPELQLPPPRYPAAGRVWTFEEEARWEYPDFVNDLALDRRGAVLAVAFSTAPARRTREVYAREKRGELDPERDADAPARVDARDGRVLDRARGHRGVVATAAVSPDGRTLLSGGWDRTVRLHAQGLSPRTLGWAVRRVRFSLDGRWAFVAAWTPQGLPPDGRARPAALALELAWSDVEAPGAR